MSCMPQSHFHTSRLWLSLFFMTAYLSIFSAPVLGEAVTTNDAQKTDAQIAKLVEQLQAKLAKNPDLKKGPAAVLYRCYEFDSTLTSHVALRNYILLINDPASAPAKSRTLGYPEQADINYLGGWIWRKGNVIRLDESNWNVAANGGQNPQEATFSFPELKKGDLVCYTVECKYEYPFTSRNVKLSGDLPVMISNTRVKNGGHFSPAFLGHNLVKKKFAKKIYEEKGDYPIDVKFTVVDIPADRTDPDAPPFYEYQPFLLVYTKAQFNDMAGAWMENKSWNMIAVFVSNYRTQIEDKLAVVRPRAASLTSGLDTDAAKADAIYKFIQDDIEMVCFFDDYTSSRFEDILTDHRANRMSQSALMYAMFRSVDLPVDVLLGRDRQLGAIDRSACTMNQFTDYIIVLKGDPDRYYVPTTGPCEPGELPAGLHGLAALATKPDLKEAFRALAIEASSRSASNPESASSVFNGMLDQEDWSNWLVLP